MVARDFKTSVLPVSRKLLRFATQFLKDEEEARDVVQDIFLKLWQKRDKLHEIDNIEAFAMRMTRNRCLDVIRTKRTLELDDNYRKIIQEPIDVHLQVELSETALRIRNLISRLPDLQKKVMHMRDLEQFTYEEIGELTGLNANAIRVNLSRARKKVRDEYLKSDENGIEGNKRFIATIL